MMVFLLSNLSFVIQTTEGRKNLVNIMVDVSEILRFALNDKYFFTIRIGSESRTRVSFHPNGG